MKSRYPVVGDELSGRNVGDEISGTSCRLIVIGDELLEVQIIGSNWPFTASLWDPQNFCEYQYRNTL